MTLRNSRRDIEYDDSNSEDSDVNDRYNWINESAWYLTPTNPNRAFKKQIRSSLMN